MKKAILLLVALALLAPMAFANGGASEGHHHDVVLQPGVGHGHSDGAQ